MYCKIEKKNIVSNLLRFITTIHTIWTHLKQIECLSWTPACIFIHQIVHLSFSILLFYLFWFESIEFPSKMVQVQPEFATLGSWDPPHLKGLGVQFMALIQQDCSISLDPGPWTPLLKWPFRYIPFESAPKQTCF